MPQCGWFKISKCLPVSEGAGTTPTRITDRESRRGLDVIRVLFQRSQTETSSDTGPPSRLMSEMLGANQADIIYDSS